DQLVRTLRVKQAAVFLAQEPDAESFTMRGSVGMEAAAPPDSESDFGFLSLLSRPDAGRRGRPRERLFFPGRGEDWERELGERGFEKPSWRATIARMGLPYYFPCRARNRVVAVLGLGKTAEGEFLWEEDAALVETLAGYLA